MAQLVLCPECSRHVRQFTAHPRLAPDPRTPAAAVAACRSTARPLQTERRTECQRL